MKKDFCRICIRTILTYSIIILIICLLKAFNIDYFDIKYDNDFYIVINSLVNDYNNVIDKEDVETYVKMANAFINDTDSVKDKIWIYYNEIPKRD